MQKLFRFLSILLLLHFTYCNTVDVILELKDSSFSDLQINFSKKVHLKSKSNLKIQSNELLVNDSIQENDDDEFDYETPFLLVNEIIHSYQEIDELYSFTYFLFKIKNINIETVFTYKNLFQENSSIPPELNLI